MPSNSKKRWNCLASALRGSREDGHQVLALELVDHRDHW